MLSGFIHYRDDGGLRVPNHFWLLPVTKVHFATTGDSKFCDQNVEVFLRCKNVILNPTDKQIFKKFDIIIQFQQLWWCNYVNWSIKLNWIIFHHHFSFRSVDLNVHWDSCNELGYFSPLLPRSPLFYYHERVLRVYCSFNFSTTSGTNRRNVWYIHLHRPSRVTESGH